MNASAQSCCANRLRDHGDYGDLLCYSPSSFQKLSLLQFLEEASP
jgi:hypothetical protein